MSFIFMITGSNPFAKNLKTMKCHFNVRFANQIAIKDFLHKDQKSKVG